MCSLYLGILLRLPESVRSNLLGPPDQVEQINVQCASKIDIISLPTEWHSLSIAKAMEMHVRDNGLENLEQEHFEIIEAAVTQPFHEEDLAGWSQVFEEIKSHLYVALCDEELCDIAANVLLRLFSELDEIALKSVDILFHTLEMIYPSGPPRCQEVAPGLLIELYNLGSPFSQAMMALSESIQHSSFQLISPSSSSSASLNIFIKHISQHQQSTSNII